MKRPPWYIKSSLGDFRVEIRNVWYVIVMSGRIFRIGVDKITLYICNQICSLQMNIYNLYKTYHRKNLRHIHSNMYSKIKCLLYDNEVCHLAAISGATLLVPCHADKSLQLI